MIDPKDPSLPKIWQRHPVYTVYLATLSRQSNSAGLDDVPDPLEQAFSGWYISHDYQVMEFSPDSDEFDTFEEFLAHLEEDPNHLQEAIEQAQQVFAAHDFRKAEGLMKVFAGRSGGFLEPDQRRRLASDIAQEQQSYSNPEVVRKAFVELAGGFAVGGVIVEEKSHMVYDCEFASSANPLLTLLDREVVVRNEENEELLARGIAQVDDNTLIVGNWKKDFTGGSVYGVPFESVELEPADDHDLIIYEVYEAKFFDEEIAEEGL